MKNKFDLIRLIIMWLTTIAFLLITLLIPMDYHLYLVLLIGSSIMIFICSLGSILFILESFRKSNKS